MLGKVLVAASVACADGGAKEVPHAAVSAR